MLSALACWSVQRFRQAGLLIVEKLNHFIVSMQPLLLFGLLVIFINEVDFLNGEEEEDKKVKEGFCNFNGQHTPFHELNPEQKADCMRQEHESVKKSQSRYSAKDEYDDLKALDSVLPTAKLSRKKLSMLGSAGHYIQEFEGQLYGFVINSNWEGVWVYLSNVRLRVYGEIGEGRWRFAFRGMVLESEAEEFPVGMQIVIKTVNDDVLKEQKREEAVKRSVQTQILARKICQVAEKKAADGFGKFPEIIKVWMFRNPKHVWMVEERLEGHFKKLINNNMATINVPPDLLEDQEKAAAITHFSHNYSNGEILLTDLQGVDLRWTDVEIATRTLSDEKFFGIGNLGQRSHRVFNDEHQCNKFCKLLHLPHKTLRCHKTVVQEKKKSVEHSVGSQSSIRSKRTQNKDEILNVK